MKQVELLSPAGTLKNMRYAYAFGADAVYAGQPRYSLRVRNNDFVDQNLAKGITEAHQLGKKFYLANTDGRNVFRFLRQPGSGLHCTRIISGKKEVVNRGDVGPELRKTVSG